MRNVVIRGLFLPGGMDELDDMIHADYTTWFFSFALGRRILREWKAGKFKGPVNIVGHSLGANAARNLANALGAAGVPIGTVIMLDPTYVGPLKYGKGWAFQSGDWRAKTIPDAVNVSRADLNHMNLTTDRKVIKFIIETVGIA